MKPLQELLTVALIVKNEATHLAACLDGVKPLNCPILIIDSGSEDETLAIAEQYGAAIHQFTDWQGFGVQRNRAHPLIQTPWVLWLDADERLPEKAQQHIQIALNQTTADGQTAFAINRLPIVYGREIRHCGWYPDKVVRLYPVALMRYSDDLVHESVIVPKNAQIMVIEGDVLHDTYANLNQHFAKMQAYTLAWAQQKLPEKPPHLFWALLRSVWAFLRIYLLKRGFLDGGHGFIIAVMGAIYTWCKYAQWWLLYQKKDKA
ncbi:MAG: glycosyltransferase family 2 protein [Alysiella sp.]|uniref:glycosyltransferase family 2 protein n=1 Tax=Alysiella sp. TaxID=1872483 RepID=UPI0026DAC2CF|nr:glycosyltransferase family 2 protein [Alysiella sp.]MDO4433742.1 glycosyltransferase family 2 protein [Alysiella sp.]